MASTIRDIGARTDAIRGGNKGASAGHLLSTGKGRRNRYFDVEDRLKAQKRFYREKVMREWLAEIEACPGPGYCYFVGYSEGRIKIGSSKSPNRRLRELRRETPEKMEILAKAAGGAERERYYHSLFAEHHRGGEWFERRPDILAEIDRLNAHSVHGRPA